jgi:hypothetical protein
MNDSCGLTFGKLPISASPPKVNLRFDHAGALLPSSFSAIRAVRLSRRVEGPRQLLRTKLVEALERRSDLLRFL